MALTNDPEILKAIAADYDNLNWWSKMIVQDIPTGRFITKTIYVGYFDMYQTDKYFSTGLVFGNIKTNWWTRLCMSLFLGVKWKKERRKIYDPGRQPKTVSKQKN